MRSSWHLPSDLVKSRSQQPWGELGKTRWTCWHKDFCGDDKDNFQILRTRSDLIAPNQEIRLDQLTTDVKFGQVQLQDIPTPLWLPNDVDVFIEIGNEKYRNLHHYTNYRATK
jgi:hypothetical protein